MNAPEPRPGLRDVEPYQAPQLDVPVRLNTNECPFPLPDGFMDDLIEQVRRIPLNRYPDREALRLRKLLAEMSNIPVEGVWAANGSNEVISQLLLAYGGPGRRVALFEPTYALHSRLAWLAYSETVEIAVEPPFVITSDLAGQALAAEPNVVFVCSPNNPTGNAQPPEIVEELARSNALVIVDEAYIEFGGKSATGLLQSHPNVVIVRTFSKAFALAGARLGYCLASPEIVDDLRRVRLPYHLSSLTQAAGLVALKHAEDALAILDAVRRERDRILEALGRMKGVVAYPSDANFVLFRPPGEAKAVWNALLEKGVLVRDVSDIVEGCLRVTAGTTPEVDRFLSAFQEVLP
ncbi:MAG: histidinol-phosphate transaminase [Actinomycetota bacterium]